MKSPDDSIDEELIFMIMNWRENGDGPHEKIYKMHPCHEVHIGKHTTYLKVACTAEQHIMYKADYDHFSKNQNGITTGSRKRP